MSNRRIAESCDDPKCSLTSISILDKLKAQKRGLMQQLLTGAVRVPV